MAYTKSSVHKVGINDADYDVVTHENGFRILCPYYATWQRMIRRCYSIRELKKESTYRDCLVHPDWHSFMNFRSWMITQDWKGKHLDKDLINQGSREYSEDNCAFVSSLINGCLVKCKKNGETPIGVCYCKQTGKYISVVKKYGETIWLGRHKTELEAHAKWQKEKADYLEELAKLEENEKVKNGLMLRVGQLRNDLLNRKETLSI